jgi:putative acetyltransferase
MKYSSFHATLGDMTPRLQQIESQFALKYIPMGWQKSASGEVFTSVFDIPNFGTSKSGHFRLNDGFLVCPVESEFVIRAIPQYAGGIQYMVDPASNPGAFGFYPGGMSGPDRLIGGFLWPNTVEPSVRKLCFRFSHLLLKGFEKVLDAEHYPWWVGPEAMHLLRSDCTLVTSLPWPLALPVDTRFEVKGVEVRIRQTWDMEAIRRVLTEAFQRSNEADLVEALYSNGHLPLSLSAEIAGNVVGYLAFSGVEIKREDRQFWAQALEPLGVLPEFQGMGIGSALVRTGLEATYRRGSQIIVVSGDPTFFRRFGFEKSTPYGIRWEHDVPEAQFQVIGRNENALDGVSGVVSYMPEFKNV